MPAASPGALLAAWPRSAQWTTAFLLGIVATLLAGQALSYTRWGTRPVENLGGPGLAYRVDLNQADRAELLQLPGVGEARADRIEAYRRANGGFRSVDDLTGVKGIGPAAAQRLRPWVAVSGEDPGADESGRKPRSKKADGLTAPIDVNNASAAELQRLPGIGEKFARRIIDEREKKPFATIDELRRVVGVGPKTLERLRPLVVVGVPPRGGQPAE
jgi:competence protein ComEA